MDDTIMGFVLGLLAAVAVMYLVSSSRQFRHDIGWGQTACVSTVDRSDDHATTRTDHCLTGEELAKWAIGRGR